MLRTPTKVYNRGVVDKDLKVCLCCSIQSKERFLLYSKNGVNDLKKKLEYHLDVHFADTVANCGSYVCRRCKAEIDKLDHLKQKTEAIRKTVNTWDKNFATIATTKRVSSIGSTPTKSTVPKSARLSFSPSNRKILPMTSTPKYVKTPKSSKKALFGTTEDGSIHLSPGASSSASNSILKSLLMSGDSSWSETAGLECPRSEESTSTLNVVRPKTFKPLVTRQQLGKNIKRVVSVVCRKSKTAKNIQPIVHSLRNGSYKNGLKKIKEQAPAAFTNFVCNEVKKECEELSKIEHSSELRQTEPRDILTIDLQKIKKQILQQCPLVWKILCAVGSEKRDGKNRKQQFPEAKVMSAMLTLCNARNRNLNRFQVANALAMYRYDIKKEGIDYLSTMGVCTSSSTLYKKLAQIEKKVVSDNMAKLREGVQTNVSTCTAFLRQYHLCNSISVMRYLLPINFQNGQLLYLYIY